MAHHSNIADKYPPVNIRIDVDFPEIKRTIFGKLDMNGLTNRRVIVNNTSTIVYQNKIYEMAGSIGIFGASEKLDKPEGE